MPLKSVLTKMTFSVLLLQADPDADLLRKLGQFGICAGFSFVGLEDGYIRVGVVRDADHMANGQKQFENLMNNPGKLS